MTAGNLQIVHLFENLQLSPEEIASNLELELGAVLLSLSAESSKYRREMAVEQKSKGEIVKEEDVQLFNTADVSDAAAVIANLMRDSEDEHVRMRAAKFVVNEGKGRNDTKAVKNLNVSVNYINEQMQRARAAKDRAKETVIDVSA